MAFLTTPSNGTEYARYYANPATKVRGALWGGPNRYAQTAAMTLAAGGQVNLFRLNVGDVVLDGSVQWIASGAANMMWIGDAGDCDRYKTQFSTAVASLDTTGGALGDCTRFNAITGRGFAVTSTTQDIILTNSYAAATGALAAGAFKVVIHLGTE